MTILITGATGQLGRLVIDSLIARGAVTALHRGGRARQQRKRAASR